MDPVSRCKYMSKPCANERSRKDDGSLHRFCTLHRAKANDAQRRWHARQRHSSLARRSKGSCPDEKNDKQPAKRVCAELPRGTHGDIHAQMEDAQRNATFSPSPDLADDSWSLMFALPPLDTASVHACSESLEVRLKDLGDFIMELDDFIIEDAKYVPSAIVGTSVGVAYAPVL